MTEKNKNRTTWGGRVAAAGVALLAGAGLSQAAAPVSPTGNGRHETSFQAAVSYPGAGVVRWEFRVASDRDAKVVRKIVGDGVPPKAITWNSKDDAGKP